MKTFHEIIFLTIFLLCLYSQPAQAAQLPTVGFWAPEASEYEHISPIALKVDLSKPSSQTVTVNYSVTGGTATGEGVDYSLSSGVLTFAPGEITKYISIAITDDSFGELDETIEVTLSDPTNAILGTYSSHTYTIVNNDFTGVEFLETASSGLESVHTVTVTVGLFTWFTLMTTATVDYTVSGTATGGGVDYTLNSGTLTFLPGEFTKDLVITITDDSIVEPDETIIITLSNPSPDITLGSRTTYTYTILNDDDETPPNVSGSVPEPNSVQIARDTCISLHITDNLSGVDVNTVKILVEGQVVYNGASAEPNGTYVSATGRCRRVGTDDDYKFVFVPSAWFDYEQKVDVLVYATDKFGNNMPNRSYSFYTIMRSFGQNIKVNSDSSSFVRDHPATATDASGNIWVVWDQTNGSGETDIYVGKMTAGSSSFGTSAAICSTSGLQDHPTIAVDDGNDLYVAWQGKASGGFWDIYVSKCENGITWKTPILVNVSDPNNLSNQTLPKIAIDRAATDVIYIVYEDDRAGNKDIWITSSTNGTTWTPKRITTNTKDQTEPAITVNNHVVYIGWTDARNASTDLYGASSDHTWAEEGHILTSSNQSNVILVADPVGGAVHEFWVDDASGYDDIYHRVGESNSTGISITDEENKGKSRPSAAIMATGSTSRAFAAWRDWRNVINNSDTDIYYTEEGPAGFGTNVLINNDTGTSPQSSPAVGVNHMGGPYIVWVDQRNGTLDIFYTGATTLDEPLSLTYDKFGEAVVIRTTESVQIVIPSVALSSGFSSSDITIAGVLNPPGLPAGGFGVCYDVGPSGMQFDTSVSISIPHTAAECPGYTTYQAYWYNTQTGTWSQEGISGTQHYVLNETIHSVNFQTSHLTAFVIGGSLSSGGEEDSGLSSGGCAMSPYPSSSESIGGFFVPYVIYILTLLLMSWSIKRKQKPKKNNT